MIARIKIPYQVYDMKDEDYVEMRGLIKGLPDDKKTAYLKDGGLVELDEIVEPFSRWGIPIEVTEVSSGHSMYVKLKDAVTKCQLKLSELYQNGAAVQVHVPNLGLLSMDEVTHIDDACTDALQEMLNEGWRILAVCPPNAQRRPDYILGRSKSSLKESI